MDIKGKRTYSWLFFISVLLVAAVLVSVFFLNKESFTLSQNVIANYNEGWEYKGENIALPCKVDSKQGETIKISKVLPSIITDDSNLFFMSENKGITVYVDDIPIFYYSDGRNYLFGDNLGFAYIKVPLLSSYEGKEIVIEVSPRVETMSNALPTIKIGNTASIVSTIFKEHYIGLLISVLIFMLSLFFLFEALVIRKHPLNVDSLLYLSVTGIVFSVWTASETMIWQIFYGNTLFMYYLLYLSIMLVPMPMIMCIKALFRNVNIRSLNVMLFLCFINVVVCVFLDIFDVSSLSDTLVITHIIMVLTVFILFYMMAKHYFKEHKIIKYAFAFFLVTVLLDVGRYYLFSPDNTGFFTKVGILVFLFAVGRDTLYGLLFEIQANKKYKEMAYHDTLTEALSWVALTERVRAIKNIKKCAIALFDLNNLKFCNDNYGHGAGDTMITNSVMVIKEAFEEWGGVYRIGGDEFLVLMYGATIKEFDLNIEKLHRLIKEHNIQSHIEMQIAYGFASYENAEDNFETIKNRADKKMYETKRKIKSGNTKFYMDNISILKYNSEGEG